MAEIRVTYDPQADAAYIYLVDEINAGEAKTQVICGEEEGRAPEIVLDLDAHGMLLGVEVLDASRRLPPQLLKQAEPIGWPEGGTRKLSDLLDSSGAP